jgi:hypothetical protein
VEGAAGRDVIDELDGGDLDEAIAFPRVEPGGLGIENDLAHDSPESYGLSRPAQAAAVDSFPLPYTSRRDLTITARSPWI